MIGFLAVGLGAGLVSALLFAVIVTGSPLAILLSYVASLPVLIAALGWNHRAGLVAAFVGAAATALVFTRNAAVAYAVGAALPGWWLAYLALLGKPRGDGAMEWYPLGRILLWIAGLAATITLIGVLALGQGDEAAYRAALQRAIEGVVRFERDMQGGDAAAQPPGSLSPAIMAMLIAAVPFVAAMMFSFVLTLNLWLAAKVVAISGRLPRPWPAISEAAMPRAGLAVLAAAVLLALLPGMPGIAGLALSGAVATAFALQGLAVLHAISRNRPGRSFVLGFAYMLVLFVGHTVLPLLALAGMADTAFGLRARLRSGPPST
jgi:hypothetical protein